MFFHAPIHWTEVADRQLCFFTLHHAVYLWNTLSNPGTKLSPLAYISQSHVRNYLHLTHPNF